MRRRLPAGTPSANERDGAVGVIGDLRADAAEQELGKGRLTARTKDDQIDLIIVGIFADDLRADAAEQELGKGRLTARTKDDQISFPPPAPRAAPCP